MEDALNLQAPNIIEIEKITVRDELNVRSQKLLTEVINEYAECIDRLPAVSLFKVDDILYLVDGWHRVAAACKAGVKVVAYELVGVGTLDEARDYADAANLHHGVKLTAEQRREAIRRYISRHPDMPEIDVARNLGIPRSSIYNATKEVVLKQDDTNSGWCRVTFDELIRDWRRLQHDIPPVEKWTPKDVDTLKTLLNPINEFCKLLWTYDPTAQMGTPNGRQE